MERLEEDIFFFDSNIGIAPNIKIGLEIAKEIVQEVAKEYGNGWIPVESELPKEDGYYLTCDEHGNIHTFYHFKHEIYPFGIAPSNGRFYQPIAWSELPAPYQKGE